MRARISLPSGLASIDAALTFVRQRAPSWVTTETIDFGLTEAVTNAVTHGAAPDAAPGAVFNVGVEGHGDTFQISVTWFGRPCPEDARAGTLPADPFAEHGRGLAILHALFDAVAWSDDGFTVVLLLRRPAAVAPADRNPQA